jgi:predicted Zn-dependent protease
VFSSASFQPLQKINRRGRLAFFLLPLLFAGCGNKTSGPPPRYAYLNFENLTGDPSLDWTGRGTGEYLSRSLRANDVISSDAILRAGLTLGPRPASAPGGSSMQTAAEIGGANRIISGYVEKASGGIRLTASEEDASTHKTLRTVSVTAPSPFEAMNQLAHQFSPHPAAPPTLDAEAFRLYCNALQSVPADALPLLEQAVQRDPSFGRAWVALARTRAATGDRAGAERAIEDARSRQIAPIDRAWLDFEAASMGSDRAATLNAMRKMSEFDSGDLSLARTLATSETAAGNFSAAAAVWKKLTVTAPQDADAWNQLGYTLSWSGDYNGALAAVREYALLHPNEANPLDSQGDIQYWFGKFADAAASYSAAYTKSPAFLNGGEMYKAAWAKFLSGDKAGADATFARFKDAREKANDPSINFVAADWLYRTGREKEARALLADSLKKEIQRPPTYRPTVSAEFALWDLLAGDRAAAAKDLAEGNGMPGMTSGDIVVRFSALPSATPSEWETRSAKYMAIPQLAALRNSALGYALILDGKKEAATPVWEEIVKQAAGNDFFPRNILARLKNQRIEHTPPPDPINLNQFAPVLYKLQ